MKTYRIEYKKVVVAYRRWFVPVYAFRFCIIETETSYSIKPPSYHDTISAYPDIYDFTSKMVTETIVEKLVDEAEACNKLQLLQRYNTSN